MGPRYLRSVQLKPQLSNAYIGADQRMYRENGNSTYDKITSIIVLRDDCLEIVFQFVYGDGTPRVRGDVWEDHTTTSIDNNRVASLLFS